MLLVQKDVDDLIVVGGASRMPWLREALRNHFPQRTVMHMTDADINAVHMTRSDL
jgi:molecular chaperone DnaK (HSP70)